MSKDKIVLSPEREKAITQALEAAKELKNPGEERLIAIDPITKKAERLAMLSLLAGVLRTHGEELHGGVVSSMLCNENTETAHLKVAIPQQS